MKVLTLLFAIAGLALGTGLVAYFGFSEVARALFTVRWTGFLMIVVFHLALTALLGVCWYLLTSQSAPLRAFVFGRFVRDSGSEILPLSQVGGFVMGTRAAVLLGLPGAVAIASTIVDLTLEMIAQLGYTALGLSILSAQPPNNHLIAWTALGIVLALLAAIVFILVQRHGFTVVESILRRRSQSVGRRCCHALGADPSCNSRNLSPSAWALQRGSSPFCHVGRERCRGVDCVASYGLKPKCWLSDCDRKFALCNPQRSLSHAECLWRPRGRLCLARYVVWLRPRSRSRSIAPETRAGPCDRCSGATYLADTRRPPVDPR